VSEKKSSLSTNTLVSLVFPEELSPRVILLANSLAEQKSRVSCSHCKLAKGVRQQYQK